MFTVTVSTNGGLLHSGARSLRAKFSVLHFRFLLGLLCWLNGVVAHAQSGVLPSHGKIRLDSYSKLLRDVHPASQAQANYLQNLLILCGLKKAERLERQERVDVYAERQLIKALQNECRVLKRLMAGSPTSDASLTPFWALVAVFGDRAEVYDALSSDVPPIPHDQFVSTRLYLRIVQPSGELALPPLLLEGSKGIDASTLQSAWSVLARNMRANGRLSAAEVADFRNSVINYRAHCAVAMTADSPYSGRFQAKKYLTSLGSLADALYRPKQHSQIQQYVAQGGNSYSGGSMLGLIQHMLRNRVTPAHGSTAQVALAEVARPISRVLEQEIALHHERIDSLAANEGHRPYAAEYRSHEEPVETPGMEVTQAAPTGNSGT